MSGKHSGHEGHTNTHTHTLQLGCQRHHDKPRRISESRLARHRSPSLSDALALNVAMPTAHGNRLVSEGPAGNRRRSSWADGCFLFHPHPSPHSIPPSLPFSSDGLARPRSPGRGLSPYMTSLLLQGLGSEARRRGTKSHTNIHRARLTSRFTSARHAENIRRGKRKHHPTPRTTIALVL